MELTCATLNPLSVKLDQSFEEILNRRDAVLQTTYLPDERLSYHGVSHPGRILGSARTLVARCWEAGIPVDVNSLERALTLHDALLHVNPRLLGFPSSEHLAAFLTKSQALQEGCPMPEAERSERIVMATNPEVRPTTPEEIIMRAADLSNLPARYDDFLATTRLLHREAQLRRGDAITLEQWLPGAYAYLRQFLWPMLELTPAARDARGRSAWHSAVMENIFTLWKSSFPESHLTVDARRAEGLQMPAPEPHQMYMRVLDDEPRRQQLLAELGQRSAKDSVAFVLPGRAHCLPLPLASCDQLLVDEAQASDLEEAARVLKPQALLRVQSADEQYSRADLICAARRMGLELDTQDPLPGELHFRKREAPAAKAADSMRGWAVALADAQLPQFSDQLIRVFREPMRTRFERLQSMGLVSVPMHTCSADALFQNQGSLLAAMPQGALFIFLEPKDPSSHLPRWHGALAPDRIVEKIQGLIGEYAPQDFTVIVQPAYKIRYNANIMVQEDGAILAEFADGKDLPSRMDSQILFTARRDALSGLFSYTTPNQQERALAYQVLASIPGAGAGRERQYLPGYYEVAVAHGATEDSVRPLFFDYRRHPFFLGQGSA